MVQKFGAISFSTNRIDNTSTYKTGTYIICSKQIIRMRKVSFKQKPKMQTNLLANDMELNTERDSRFIIMPAVGS